MNLYCALLSTKHDVFVYHKPSCFFKFRKSTFFCLPIRLEVAIRRYIIGN